MNFTDVNIELNNRIKVEIDNFCKKNNISQLTMNHPALFDIISNVSLNLRLEKMNNLFSITNRNIICYFSTWVQRPILNPDLSINDNDINGFMNAIQGMNRNLGLDIMLHTPGGSVTATESIVEYLKKSFNNDIRVIVPHMAMSAGTMIACSAKEILMGKQSSLGPIDPQYKNVPTQGVIKEFDQAMEEIMEDPNKALIWREIIRQYRPTFIGECKNIVSMSKEMVYKWLKENMFLNDIDAEVKIKTIMDELSEHEVSKVHDRHYDYEKCKDLKLKVISIESDQKMQNAILELYHSYVASTYVLKSTIKFIESKDNRTFVINGIL